MDFINGSVLEHYLMVQSDSFQSDIYPPAPSDEHALTAAEFFSGRTAQPKLVDLNSGEITSSFAAVSTPPPPIVTYSASTTATRTYTAPAPVAAPTFEATPVSHRKAAESAPNPISISTPAMNSALQTPVPTPREDLSHAQTSAGDVSP